MVHEWPLVKAYGSRSSETCLIRLKTSAPEVQVPRAAPRTATQGAAHGGCECLRGCERPNAKTARGPHLVGRSPEIAVGGVAASPVARG